MAFLRVAGTSAILAGINSVIYSLAFVALVTLEVAPDVGQFIVPVTLLFGGFLTVLTFAGVYRWLIDVETGTALVALMLGALAGIGAAIHGGYDLAVALHPPGGDLGPITDLPNPIDPRGLLSFGAAGFATLTASWLVMRGGNAAAPTGLGYLGYFAGTVLLAIYLGRLFILDPTNPLVAIPAVLAGFVVVPAWYVWLGLTIRSHAR